MSADAIRTFISAPVDRPLIGEIQKLQARLRTEFPGESIRWSAEEQLHLTLKFLGGLPADRVDAVGDALRRACEGIRPFRLCVEGVGCFPSPRRPNVVWVGIGGEVERLNELKLRIDRAVGPFSDRADDRPFHPHLTIGRVRPGRTVGPSRLGEAIRSFHGARLGEWRVGSVRLMRSELSPEGAVHTILLDVVLNGGGG